tara:strand:- start:1000 stop:1449 length:450 start_codon:yes stop_codon:yes gene_type:complete
MAVVCNSDFINCPGCGKKYYIGVGAQELSGLSFKRNEAGVLKLQDVSFCMDCPYQKTLSKLKLSKWLQPVAWTDPSDDYYYSVHDDWGQRICDNKVTENDFRLCATLIIQHAFRNKWDVHNLHQLYERAQRRQRFPLADSSDDEFDPTK